MGKLENELLMGTNNNFPKDIKKYTHKNISLIKPSFYILNMETYFDNYHFVIPTTQPPPLKIENKQYFLKDNRVMPVNYGQTLKVNIVNPKTKSNEPEFLPTKEYIALFIDKELLQNITYNACGKTNVQFYNETHLFSKKLKDLLDFFTQEVVTIQQGRTLMMDSICVQISIQLIRDLKSNISYRIFEKEYESKSHVNIAIEFLREYYNSNINLDDLCKVTNLSPYHLIRIFKAETGKTPHSYLLDVKIEKAQEMIKTKHYSLNEIAHLCGFVRQSHFSTVFKKRTGITPLAYLKSL